MTSSRGKLELTSAWGKARGKRMFERRVYETARGEGHCGERRVQRDEGASDACPKSPSIFGSFIVFGLLLFFSFLVSPSAHHSLTNSTPSSKPYVVPRNATERQKMSPVEMVSLPLFAFGAMKKHFVYTGAPSYNHTTVQRHVIVIVTLIGSLLCACIYPYR